MVCLGCNILALGMTIGCALSSSIGSLTTFRFLAGCFGGVPLAVGGGTVADISVGAERGKWMGLSLWANTGTCRGQYYWRFHLTNP